MTDTLTFWTELSDSTEKKWVHALPIGTWRHPIKGVVNHTFENIQRFADNINNRIRGIDLYANYDHREKGGDAAGWIKAAEAREDGLWVQVDWTEKAAKKLEDKEYRYWSSEYMDEWENPHTGQKHKDVLIGGALTNIPYLKNLVPINLSELDAHKEEQGMDRDKLIKLLGLDAKATDEQIETKLNEEVNKTPEKVEIDLSKLEFEQDGKTIKVKHPEAKGETTFEVKPIKADQSEEEKELAKLAESNPAIAKLMEDQAETRAAMKRMEAATRLSEVTTQLNELGSTEKMGLPPIVKDRLRKVMAQLPTKLSEEVHGALVDLFKVGGLVDLSETKKRTPAGDGGGSKDAVSEFMDKVDELQAKDEKLSYRDAVDAVALSEPDLWDAYQEAMETGDYELAE